ncbi:MAG: flagellar basal body L-ring protein FlgH [Armatimonadetes bacterium]|nr:flagellar basal body L-ring protein FlgH [Armatimonadota bacterium]
MRKLILLGLLGLPLLATAQEKNEKQNPGTLLKPDYTNPLSDRVARHVGDILTVVVEESTVATYAANTETSKSEKGSFSPGFVFDIIERIFRGFSTSGSSESKGDGKTTQTSNLKTTLSVVVKEVLPNGNLVVEGDRSITTNKDTQTATLSGVVRPFDIAPDNTVPSTKIAGVKIAVAGKGQIADRQRKGLLTRLLDWLF